MIDPPTLILILYIYTFGVALLGLFYARRKLAEPDLERCRYCSLYRLCSRLGLNKVAPPVRYVRRAPRSFKVAFGLALGAGYTTILVVALLVCRIALLYVMVALLLPMTIARSIIKM